MRSARRTTRSGVRRSRLAERLSRSSSGRFASGRWKAAVSLDTLGSGTAGSGLGRGDPQGKEDSLVAGGSAMGLSDDGIGECT